MMINILKIMFLKVENEKKSLHVKKKWRVKKNNGSAIMYCFYDSLLMRFLYDQEKDSNVKEKFLVSFGFMVINHCWLFNAKTHFYIYIRYRICKHILLIHAIV